MLKVFNTSDPSSISIFVYFVCSWSPLRLSESLYVQDLHVSPWYPVSASKLTRVAPASVFSFALIAVCTPARHHPWCPASSSRRGLTKTFGTGSWQNSNKSTTHNYPPRYGGPLASTAISILTTPTYLQSQNLCILNEAAGPRAVATGLDKIPL